MKEKPRLSKLFNNIIDFLYPPVCLHCDSLIEGSNKFFCQKCFSEIDLINPEERCRTCFSPDIEDTSLKCTACKKNFPLWIKAAAAVDHKGPAATLIAAMKYENQPYLAKGAAAFMASQFIALNWPFPDVIVPVPISFIRFTQRGYNQSEHLSNYLGEILNRPVSLVLKRKSGGYSQAGLDFSERKKLSVDSFWLKNASMIQDKNILLIDDVMTTGSTLHCCTETLLEGFPASIYVMTFSKAL